MVYMSLTIYTMHPCIYLYYNLDPLKKNTQYCYMLNLFIYLLMQHPDEFVEVMLASIIERSNRLLQRVAIVHKALLEIVALTTISPQTNGKSADTAHRVSATPVKSKQQQAAVTSSSTSDKRRGSISNKSTPQHEPSSRMLSGNKYTSSNSMVYATTPTHRLMDLTLHQFGPADEEVLRYFCKLVNQAVMKAVLSSHGRFLSSLLATAIGETTAHSTPNTRASSTEKSVKFSTPDDVEINKEGETTHSKTQLSLSDSKPGPLLQLTVDVHFATPRIQLEPTLDNVHSDLLEVSDALLRVLHQVRWWARPNAGRTLYEVYEVGAKENDVRSTILKSIQGNQLIYLATILSSILLNPISVG